LPIGFKISWENPGKIGKPDSATLIKGRFAVTRQTVTDSLL